MKFMSRDFNLNLNPKELVIISQLKSTFKDKLLKLLVYLASKGFLFRIVQGLRSLEEQAKLYDQGRTTPGPIVTKAKPGTSMHNYGYAVDVYPIIDGKVVMEFNKGKMHFHALAAAAPTYGLRSGATFKGLSDWPHIEDADANIKALYNQYIDGSNIINKQKLSDKQMMVNANPVTNSLSSLSTNSNSMINNMSGSAMNVNPFYDEQVPSFDQTNSEVIDQFISDGQQFDTNFENE